jgi:Undecaprenyl-phosphate glucose phosphotransferase
VTGANLEQDKDTLMPGMAEPDIAIDIADGTSELSAVRDDQSARFAPRARLAGRTARLIGLDAAVTAYTGIVCFAIFNPARHISSSRVVLPMACLTVCMILSFFERGLYDAPEVMSRELPWRKIILAWLQAVAVGTLATFCAAAVWGPLAPGFEQLGATMRGVWLPTFLVVGFWTVIGARRLRLRFHSGPQPLNRTVVIGQEEQIHDLLFRIRTAGRRSFDVIGVVRHPADGTPQETLLGLPHIDDIDVLVRMIRQDAVDTVLVALPWSAGEQTQAVIDRMSMAPVDVYIYPGMNGLNLPLRRAHRTFDLPLLMACTRPIVGWGALIKRAEDVALSLALLIFISPVMLTIAAGIKLTSRGPIFFRQRRLGYNNRVIEVLKFRSMYTHLTDVDASQQALRGDKRVTPFGAWLRRTSMDELPQLLNVLKGDMSLVGPRPHALATTAGGLALEEAVPVYPSRHRVKPGITGWAQVNGYRGALDSVDKIVHRVNHDLYYIENWSLAFDLKILWRTARLVFADDNAF